MDCTIWGLVKMVDNNPMESLTEIRVRYAETDQMGIVHHSNYLVWMELGRSDYLRQLGHSYVDWEKQGIRLVVAGIRIKYRAPALYDERVQIRTRLLEGGRRKVVFGYRMERNGICLAEGESEHLVTGIDGKARILPEELLKLIKGSELGPSAK